MTVCNDLIYVSTSHDSHLCFEVSQVYSIYGPIFKFNPLFSDSRQRNSLRHLVYTVTNTSNCTLSSVHKEATITLVTDKSGSVSGLLQPSDLSRKSATTTLFEACLPRSVIRVQRGDVRPPWRRHYKHDSPGDSAPHGVLNDDVIGACTDGTVISFTTINYAALDILRLLQNLIEAKQKKDPVLQFSTVPKTSGHVYNLLQTGGNSSQKSSIKAREVDPEVQRRGPGAARFRHVDGDLLITFFGRGGSVRDLVESGCDRDVCELFLSKCLATFPAQGGETGKDEAYILVEAWAKDVLMPLL